MWPACGWCPRALAGSGRGLPAQRLGLEPFAIVWPASSPWHEQKLALCLPLSRETDPAVALDENGDHLRGVVRYSSRSSALGDSGPWLTDPGE